MTSISTHPSYQAELHKSLDHVAILHDAELLLLVIQEYFAIAPQALNHQRISLDCFHLLSKWMTSTSIDFDPFSLFQDLKPHSTSQFITLAALYFYQNKRPDRARELCHEAISLFTNYQPAHYLLHLIDGHQLPLESDWVCPRAFTNLDLKSTSCFVCCTSWLPYSVGNPQTQTATEIWDGEAINLLRSSMTSGEYKYCNPTYCSHLHAELAPDSHLQAATIKAQSLNTNHRQLSAPLSLQLSYDNSCNLACPSCRPKLYRASSEESLKLDAIAANTVHRLISSGVKLLAVTYSGDAFASDHYRSLLLQLNPAEHPTLRLRLLSNGLLITPSLWHKLSNIWPIIHSVSISVDAASSSTYSVVRPPGNWNQLLSNLSFLSSWRAANPYHFPLTLNFCVQPSNFREMPSFLELALELGFDDVYFQRMLDWGHFPPGHFQTLNISDPSHPVHNDLLSVLNHQYFANPASAPVPYRVGVLSSQ